MVVTVEVRRYCNARTLPFRRRLNATVWKVFFDAYCISASVEEYIHVGLFATVRGTFKCLHALASRPEEKH